MQGNIKKKWYQKTWVRAIGIICLVIILGFLLFAFLVFQSYSKLYIKTNGNTTSLQTNKVTTVDGFDLSIPVTEVAQLVFNEENPHFGPKEAPITIVEYFDFRCHYCKQLHPILRRLMVEYKDQVHFVFRDYPLIGADSNTLALAGRCANEQDKFLAFYDKIYGNAVDIEVNQLVEVVKSIGMNPDQFESCVNSRRYQDFIDQDLRDAGMAGVTGTPTLFVNGHVIPGAPPYSILKRIIDTTLRSLNK